MAGGIVSAGAVRDTPPDVDDYGYVVRPVGGGPGGVVEVEPLPKEGAVTSVAASLVPVLLLAANPLRTGFSVRNSSGTATLYLLANTTGGVVSATNHTVAIYPGYYYEDPYRYVGDVYGVWVLGIAPGDLALVTEYTPV